MQSHATSINALRNQIRAKRRALSRLQQSGAAQQLARLVCRQGFFLRAKRVALYVANDGEIDPHLIRELTLASGKRCYLPLLHPLQSDRMYFARIEKHTRLRLNRFGIPEPSLRRGKFSPAWSLDCVFLPLVAFDRSGNRLGMGGGFYDRTFAFRAKSPHPKPLLVGLAHSCQEIDQIAARRHDVALDYIATEKELICAKPK